MRSILETCSAEVRSSLPQRLYCAAQAALRDRSVALGASESKICAELLQIGVNPSPRIRVRGYSGRTTRRILRKSGLPCPGDWVGISHCTMTIKSAETAETSLERAALATFWHDASAFSRRCLVLFGRRPGALRGSAIAEMAEIWITKRSRL